MVKLIATDLDGTLLGPAAQISQRSLDALHLARQAGVEVVAATGRGWHSATQVLAEARSIQHLVCSNGALLFDRLAAEIVRYDAIAPDAVGVAARAVHRAFDDIGMGWELSDGTFGWDEVFLDHNRAIELRDGHTRVERLPVDDPPAAVLKLLVSARGLGEEELLDRLAPHMPEDIETTASGISFVEITGRGVHKAKALQDLCDDLAITPADVVAFGDNRNDVAMLEWAGTSYAMANGHPAARAAADREAPDHADDGVAQVIEALLG